MLYNLKALVVVLTFASIVFALAKPICLRFTAPEDFARRRWVWLTLTVVAFVSPSYWLYVLIALPLIAWAGRKDASPLALYLLLYFVIPPMEIEIPTVGINRLFYLNQVRLMGFAILLPWAWSRVRAAKRGEGLNFNAIDGLLLAYGALQLASLIPYEATTNTLRRAFLYLLDTYLVYFVFSRASSDRRAIVDAMGALTLSACIVAPIAVFETMSHWLMYTGIGSEWGAPNVYAWLFRDSSLRAQVSTGHAITLGYVMAIAIGFWAYLKSMQQGRAVATAVFALLTLALYVTYSRGPWLTAVLVALVYFGVASRDTAMLVKGVLLLGAAVGAMLVSPFGSTIVANLPFIGTVGQETVQYREQLAEVSWELIQQNPWFGNPFVLLQMEELRQGQGIIDLVNAYASVALFHGLVGLALYLGAFAVALRRAYSRLRQARREDDYDAMTIGASLLACLLATLVFMATAGFAWFQWVLLGLTAGYAALWSVGAPVSDETLGGQGSVRLARAGSAGG